MAKIYLSPSNQNGNLYAYGSTNEMEQCDRIADAAKTALERCSFTVKKAPKGQAMSTTISESNSWKPDLHMCIHTNAGGRNGTMCMVYSKATENMKYATPIYNAVQAVTLGKTNYGVREMPELAELNGTSCIAVYTEVDFHDNAAIAKWLIENPQTVGKAFAKGVCSAFGVTYKAPTTASSVTANTISDLTKFINQAKTYIGKNGSYVCNTQHNNLAATSTFKRKTRNLSDSFTYAFYRPNWAETTKSNQTLYCVQVGAFVDKNNAEAYLKKIQAAGYKDAFITTNNK